MIREVREEQGARWLMEHLSANGASLQGIADELNRLRVPTRSGGEVWSKYVVRSVLARTIEPAATG